MNHYEMCPHYPIECNQCGEFFRRWFMGSHRKSLCPDGIIECEFKSYGCDSTMKRKEATQHDDENMKKHLSLVQRSHSRLQSDFASSQHQYLLLQQRMNVLSSKVEELSKNDH